MDAAVFSKLVPRDELPSLHARMHVERSGQLASYGAVQNGEIETPSSWTDTVREAAYLAWEADGRQEDQSEKFWHQALEAHRRAQAYALWELEDRPEGRAHHHWERVKAFEK